MPIGHPCTNGQQSLRGRRPCASTAPTMGRGGVGSRRARRGSLKDEKAAMEAKIQAALRADGMDELADEAEVSAASTAAAVRAASAATHEAEADGLAARAKAKAAEVKQKAQAKYEEVKLSTPAGDIESHREADRRAMEAKIQAALRADGMDELADAAQASAASAAAAAWAASAATHEADADGLADSSAADVAVHVAPQLAHAVDDGQAVLMNRTYPARWLRRHVQLSVGAMGVTVLIGRKVVDTFLYAKLEGWNWEDEHLRLQRRGEAEPVQIQAPQAREISVRIEAGSHLRSTRSTHYHVRAYPLGTRLEAL
jgi:hypothetical protein